MSSEKSMYELQFKTNKKIMKNYNWEYFKSQINKSFQNQKQKISTVKEKLMWNLFWIYEGYFGFHSSVRGLNKVKRELGFVLMALNIRKVVAQRVENNQKFIKRQFLYYFNRNCLFSLIQELYVPLPIYLRYFVLLARF